MSRLLFLCLTCLLLTACATSPPRSAATAGLLAAQSAREAELGLAPHWSMSGRLSVSAAGEGGSGRIEWDQRGEDFEIRLSAPVTRKSWRLLWRDGLATLEGLDDGPRQGPDPEALLEEATGWRIPVSALSAWARGARAAGAASVEFSPEGLPALISQQGWVVEYREWDQADPAMPRRVFASQDQASVRLVVDSWTRP
jgi:outer membrane lipoprotein LolB